MQAVYLYAMGMTKNNRVLVDAVLEAVTSGASLRSVAKRHGVGESTLRGAVSRLEGGLRELGLDRLRSAAA